LADSPAVGGGSGNGLRRECNHHPGVAGQVGRVQGKDKYLTLTRAEHPGILKGMELQTQHPQRSIDVTGLPEEAIRVVESLVSLLRAGPQAGRVGFASPEAWAKAIREWAESHSPRATPADWSRESIYAGRGE
jgi:hypothetical protein